jgi:hypothetical protein
VRGLALRLTVRESLTQPAERVVNLPEREFMYAERVDQHFESDPLRRRKQQRPPGVAWLGAGHARIDDGPRALLEHNSDP